MIVKQRKAMQIKWLLLPVLIVAFLSTSPVAWASSWSRRPAGAPTQQIDDGAPARNATTAAAARPTQPATTAANTAPTTAAGSNEWTPAQAAQGANDDTIITIQNTVILPSVKRMGINIGAYDQYAAAQYLRNVIPNPGFESAEFAMMFLTAPGAAPNRVQADNWNFWAHPNGFWNGAQYEIVHGPAKGARGRVSQFAVENGRYTFYLEGNAIAPSHRDPIIVRMDVPGYWTETPTNFQAPAPGVTRPGSPGTQSLMLRPSGWQPSFYSPLDSFARDADVSAGKLRIIQGRYQFELWARAEKPGQSIEIKFQRVREKVFYLETVPLTTNWQKIERRFEVPVGDDALIPNDINPLTFEVRIASGDGNVWIDDAKLEPFEHDQRNPSAFTDNFVNLLRELRPGVLRNWGLQLGTSLDNQISHQWARRTSEYDPNELRPERYHYSLHEFLGLARAVGAEPWYVIPPTWSPEELRNLIAYLSAPAGSHPYADRRAALGQAEPWTSVFPVIHLEFGNEMWGGNTSGDPFRGATLWDGYHLGRVVGERLTIMRSAPFYNQTKFNLIIGGQAGFPMRQMEIQSTSSTHDTIGLGPYFSNNFTVYNNTSNIFYPTFANPTAMAGPNGKMIQSRQFAARGGAGLAIYEINTHLTHGDMPNKDRNDFVASLGMGIALPLHMLTYQRDVGIRTQAAFTALQYSFQMPGRGGERVKLWGLLRDSEATQTKRPTWLGMEIANRAVMGNMIQTVQSGKNPTWTQQPINGIEAPVTVPFVQSFAFQGGNSYGVVIFNLNLYEEQAVRLQFPTWNNTNGQLHKLTGSSIYANNEQGVQVRITSENIGVAQNMQLRLPPHSIYVLTWTGN